MFSLWVQSWVHNLLNSWLNVQSCLNYLPNVTFIHSAKRKLYVKRNSICSLHRYTDVCVCVHVFITARGHEKIWLQLIQMFHSTFTYLTASLKREYSKKTNLYCYYICCQVQCPENSGRLARLKCVFTS